MDSAAAGSDPVSAAAGRRGWRGRRGRGASEAFSSEDGGLDAPLVGGASRYGLSSPIDSGRGRVRVLVRREGRFGSVIRLLRVIRGLLIGGTRPTDRARPGHCLPTAAMCQSQQDGHPRGCGRAMGSPKLPWALEMQGVLDGVGRPSRATERREGQSDTARVEASCLPSLEWAGRSGRASLTMTALPRRQSVRGHASAHQ